MEYSLESFIDYCDNTQDNIATEGLKEFGNQIWITIKNIFLKILRFFKNLAYNINYFKNAQLSPQMSKDLLDTLQLSQPKLEKCFPLLNLVTKNIRLLSMSRISSYDKEKDSHKITGGKILTSEAPEPTHGYERLFRETNPDAELEDQLQKVCYDIDNSLKAATESSQYSRLKENKYDTKNVKNIPLSPIISDIKKSQMECTKYTGYLDKLNALTKNQVNKRGIRLVNRAKAFFTKAIQYYKFRISLLNIYFNHAKASLSATVNNIKNALKSNKVNTKSHSIKPIFRRIRSLEELRTMKKYYADAINANTYAEYKPIYDKLTTLLNCKGLIIESIEFDYYRMLAIIIAVKDSKDTFPISNSQKLYHISENAGITELYPRWKTTAPANVLFPTPRVYFHLGVPRNRYSGKVGSEHVYEIIDKVSNIYSDKELGGTAAFTISDKPIKVKEINYAEFEKMHNAKLNLTD